MSITMRVNEEEKELIKTFANFYNMSVSDFIRNAVMERIEDEYDLMAYNKAMEEYKKNPKTYTMQEVIDSFGKDDDE